MGRGGQLDVYKGKLIMLLGVSTRAVFEKP
jgi:hypothetical protein